MKNFYIHCCKIKILLHNLITFALHFKLPTKQNLHNSFHCCVKNKTYFYCCRIHFNNKTKKTWFTLFTLLRLMHYISTNKILYALSAHFKMPSLEKLTLALVSFSSHCCAPLFFFFAAASCPHFHSTIALLAFTLMCVKIPHVGAAASPISFDS